MSDAPDPASEPAVRSWSRRAQEIGVIVWSSFLAACLASLVFFAFFDPMQLGEDDLPPAWLSSAMTGYAVGFFFFWAVCAVAACLAAYLLETLPRGERDARSS